MMRTPTRLASLIVAALAVGCSPAVKARPVVVELFESQGCSSCPPANANLAGIADRPDAIALNFAVTYWDGLDWKDPFAQPAFPARPRGRPRVGVPPAAVTVGPGPRPAAPADVWLVRYDPRVLQIPIGAGE